MQIPAPSQTPPTVTVDNSATVVRGFSTEVRSDVPPVQQGEGVRYTRGRPSDNETYVSLYGSRKKSDNSAVAQDLASPREALQTGETLAGGNATNSAPSGEAEESFESDNQTPLRDNAQAQGTVSSEDKALVEQLKKRDREVRLHELAHQAVGGQHAGSATFEYQRGPDGRNYAVGGEVSINITPTDSPEETLEKAKQIRAAALAPAQPSAQDRRVALEAEQMIADAQREMRLEETAAAKAELEARNEKLKEQAEEEAAKEAAAKDSAQTETVKADAVESKPKVSATVKEAEPAEKSTSAGEKSEGDDAPTEKKDKVTAREALEKILLAGQSLSVQANVAGYISPEAPAGQSGILDVVI